MGSPPLVDEFIQALDEEIGAIKERKGGSVAWVFDGRFVAGAKLAQKAHEGEMNHGIHG